MIKAEELRIGNYIRNDGQNLRVTEISAIMVVCDNWGFDNLEEIQGIPLTPEILEKCRFERYGRWYSKADIKVSLEGTLAVQEWITKSTPIRYVHQIQNLFYALVGEELTINL